jgi:hypothetical protein
LIEKKRKKERTEKREKKIKAKECEVKIIM